MATRAGAALLLLAAVRAAQLQAEEGAPLTREADVWPSFNPAQSEAAANTLSPTVDKASGVFGGLNASFHDFAGQVKVSTAALIQVINDTLENRSIVALTAAEFAPIRNASVDLANAYADYVKNYTAADLNASRTMMEYFKGPGKDFPRGTDIVTMTWSKENDFNKMFKPMEDNWQQAQKKLSEAEGAEGKKALEAVTHLRDHLHRFRELWSPIHDALQKRVKGGREPFTVIFKEVSTNPQIHKFFEGKPTDFISKADEATRLLEGIVDATRDKVYEVHEAAALALKRLSASVKVA